MQEVTLIQEVENVPMINTKNLAEMFERDHKLVLRSLRGLIDEGFVPECEFAPGSYPDTQGQERPCYHLTEKAALIAMPFIGGKKAKEGQVRLVNEFIKYREQAEQEVPTTTLPTPTELAQMVIESEKQKAFLEVKVELQEIKIEEDAPKVDFYESVVADTEELHTIGEAAKLLDWGPNNLNKLLRERGWLLKTKTRVEPIQFYVKKGYFQYKLMTNFTHPHTQVLHETRKTHVTGKGLVAIKKLIKEIKDETAVRLQQVA